MEDKLAAMTITLYPNVVAFVNNAETIKSYMIDQLTEEQQVLFFEYFC